MFKDIIYWELSYQILIILSKILRKKLSRKKYLHFFMIILSKIDIWPHFCFKIPNRYF